MHFTVPVGSGGFGQHRCVMHALHFTLIRSCGIITVLKRKTEMTTTQTLALAYAETLDAYHEAVNSDRYSDCSAKERAVREASSAVYNAQNQLARAAETEAKTR